MSEARQEESTDSEERFNRKKVAASRFHKKPGQSTLKPVPSLALERAGVSPRPSNLALEREQSMREFITVGAKLSQKRELD